MKTNHHKSISEIVGCSRSMVTHVLNGTRNTDTKLAKRIIHANNIYLENIEIQDKLMKEKMTSAVDQMDGAK